jgi:hypothetical protein
MKILEVIVEIEMIFKLIIIKLNKNINVKSSKMESIKNFEFEIITLRLTG